MDSNQLSQDPCENNSCTTSKTRLIKTQSGRLLRNSLFLILWGMGLWGSLKLTEGDGASLHSICGIWGCGPPTNVLIGWHLFWCLFFAPLGYLGYRRLGGTCLLHLGQGLFPTALLMLVGIIGVDLVQWWPDATELQRSYVGRRILFAVATTIEVPAMQTLLVSLLYIVASRFKKSGDNCSGGSCSPPGNSHDSQLLPTK